MVRRFLDWGIENATNLVRKNSRLRAEVERLQAEVLEKQPKIALENDMLRAELGRLQKEITEKQPKIVLENDMLRAELGRLQKEILEKQPKIVLENDKLRTELGRLQAQIAEEQECVGMPVRRFIDAHRALAEVPVQFRAKQIAFLHIGKTAGTTFHNYIRSVMLETPVFQGSPELFDEIHVADLHSFGLVLGHFSFKHVSKLRKPNFIITFLRDPIERVLSSYYHLRREPLTDDLSDYVKKAITFSKELSLEEFLASKAPEVEMFTVDHQCHALTWDFRGPRNPNRAALVNSAIENLRTFGFVGFVDEFDSCLRTLSNLFEEFPDHKDLYLNQTEDRPGKEDVSPAAIAMIEELNVADIALYKQARKLFGTKACGRGIDHASVDGVVDGHIPASIIMK